MSVRLRDALPIAVGAVVAMAATIIVGRFALPTPETQSASASLALLCCLREGTNSDTASAEFQQSVASALVASGAKILDFDAPRPAQTGQYRQLTAIVSVRGTTEQVTKSLAALAALEPRVAVARAEIANANQDGVRADLTLTQWLAN